MSASPLSGKDYLIRWEGDRLGIERYLEKIVTGIDQKIINNVGNMVINQIVSRTSRGVDVDEKAFQRYSKKYYNWKSKIRSPIPVNLQLFNNMLKDLKFRSLRTGSNIQLIFYFEGNLQQVKSWVHDTGGLSGRRNARFNMPRRHFFGVNQKEVNDLNEFVIEALRRLIRESAPGQRSLF